MIFKRKFKAYINSNKYMLLIIFTALASGGIAGSFGAMRADSLEAVTPLMIDNNKIVMMSFLENLKFLAWIALWGLNVIGFPVIIYLLYSKGAYLSAAVYFVLAAESQNQLLAVISLIPYFVCTIASTAILAQQSLNCSLAIGQNVIFGKILRTRTNIFKLSISFILASIFALLGGFCEALFKVNIA